MESDSSVVLSDTSIGRLKELLKLESRSHRDTGQCYDTLQKEYDDLLRKYAQAENTIDLLRIETLREKIAKAKEGNEDEDINLGPYNNVWKCLYDDLLHRTNKLQNAVTEFQAHLTNHEYTGEEVNDIFDSLHTDFENVANAFQSMQALGIKTSFTNEEEHPDESIQADDLEGNLYRLGLRLEEIQDEIGDKLRNDGIQLDENSNYSVSPRMLNNTDSKRSYEGECSETETTKGENNIDSDDDVNLELYNWKPATEDITELNFYKKQFGEQYLGLDPIYLSRSNSAPGTLSALQVNGDTTITPNECNQDLPKDSVELSNSQRSLVDNGVKKRRSRNSPTTAMETLHLKKPPTPEKSTSPPHPNAILTSTEDSGFLEGSHPRRHATSPLRNHYRINEGEAASFETIRSKDQDSILEESAGERYRQRLDSLRSYILAKRTANNSLSALENSDKRSRNFARGKKTGSLNYRNSPRSFNKGNVIPKMNAASNVNNDLGSSTTESVLSSAIKPAVEEKAMSNRKFTKEEKPAIQRQDIDTLRDEMRGVRDIVLDLKNSLTSPNRSSSQISEPTHRANDSQQERSPDNLRKELLQRDEIDGFRDRNNERSLFPQVDQLQNKQFEMLEKLDNKLDDISKKLQPGSVNQRQTLSRGSARGNTGRLDSPSRFSHASSYYNQVGEDNIGEFNRRPNVDDCENRRSCQQTYTVRPTESVRDINQRYGSCDDILLTNNCAIAHDNDITGYRSQAHSHRQVPRMDNSLNQRQGMNLFNHPLDENDDHFNDLNTGQRTNSEYNDYTKSYHEKFDEIGEQINSLTSHVRECKENEEKRLREETLDQQKQLVDHLREKLEKLSTRIEDQEKKAPSDAKTANASNLPVYVISCPMCGRAGAHQHGGHFFNGQHIMEQSENGGLRTNPIHPLKPMDLRQGHTALSPLLPNTNVRQNDDTFKMHSTPKNDWESQGKRSPSPIVYHHYHTVYSPPQEEQLHRQSNGRNPGDAGVHELILSNRVCDSLEKASLAAMHMESLSKKMLRGITTDLFNSGPAEF